eukprot:jgi/Orpsp1_1/1188180/evm.model.d7180000063046.1
MVTPCTDWYLVFTALAKGNVELGASILPLNLLLQILLLPLYLLIFFGGKANINSGSVILSIVIVLIIPFGLALLSKILEKYSKIMKKFIDKIRDFDENAEILFLCLAIISMFASESKSLFDNPVILFKMLIPMIIFFIVNFIGVRFIGKKLGFKDKDIVPLNFTTLARNSPLALAIAVAAFPDHPLISLALVIGSLIELPSLALIAYTINKLRKNGPESTREISEHREETSGIENTTTENVTMEDVVMENVVVENVSNENKSLEDAVTVNVEMKNNVNESDIIDVKK